MRVVNALVDESWVCGWWCCCVGVSTGVAKQLNPFEDAVKRWFVQKLRRLLLWLDPPPPQKAGSKKVTLSTLRSRVDVLYDEMCRNKQPYQDEKWIQEQVFARLQREYPQVKITTLDDIVTEVIGEYRESID